MQQTLSSYLLGFAVMNLFHGALADSFGRRPVVLAGSLGSGRALRAAEVMGADFGYMGTRFIATREANAPEEQKQMMLRSTAADIVYTPVFSGIRANYLRGSIERCGLDPDRLEPGAGPGADLFDPGKSDAKAWKDIWSAGQGVGTIHDVPTVAELVARLRREYAEAAALPSAFA